MALKRNLLRTQRHAPQDARTGRSHCTVPGRGRERGAFAIMFVPLLLLIFAVCGMALDASQMYNRKAELSGLAKAVALAAAQELNGTSEGITKARDEARKTAANYTYQYGLSIVWDETALQFSTTPARTGDWRSGSGISDASEFYFAKVDTSALESAVGTVRTFIMPMFSSDFTEMKVNDIAIAGRASINALPIAICAMSEDPGTERTNTGLADTELVEYGFRRGVSYDLMQLNPKATTPARFLINPAIAPGMSSVSFDSSTIGDFVCPGVMWTPRVQGGTIRVTELPTTSPLKLLHAQLNSRLDDYTGVCSPASAPPDANTMPYPYDKPAGAPWMSPAMGEQAAKTTTERGFLETVADIPPPGSILPGLSAGSYGPLWSFAKAVKFSSYTASGKSEPKSGYATFSTANWEQLYRAGLSANSTYPTAAGSTPYSPIGSSNPKTIKSPDTSRKEFSVALRRVLNIPLLSCTSVPSGGNATATVRGIGKFFMTVAATEDKLIAEFAGTTPEKSLTGTVELYP
ncbi:pilus assembly protein TadE [Massilia niabensis]|uniref:Pilus assembly protein TadE n=1 Tax=Massilia niabensis TaxID=544910 RepID=A0ABW0L0E4_9BURK